jgi:hypothetical protein
VTLGVQSAMAVLLVTRLCLAAFLTPSAIRKLADMPHFIEGTVAYEVLPERVARVVGFTIPWIELALALALILGVALPIAGTLAAFVLTSFALAVAVNLRRGRQINCNCYGVAATVTISWATIARICMLLAMSATVAIVSAAVVPLDRWLIPWSGDGAAASSVTAAFVLTLLIGCGIVLVYLVEWGVNVHARVAELDPTRHEAKTQATRVVPAPAANGGRPGEGLRFHSEDRRRR